MAPLRVHAPVAAWGDAPVPRSRPGVVDSATRLLRARFSGLDAALPVRLWDGTRLGLGANGALPGPPPFTLVITRPSVAAALVSGLGLPGLTEALLDGRLQIEGDLDAALRLRGALATPPAPRPRPWGGRLSWWWRARPLRDTVPAAAGWPAPSAPGRIAGGETASAFFGLWLEPQMLGSCALFLGPDTGLAQAQQDQLEQICRRLALGPGCRLLDIGAGWGGLVLHAARHHGVQALGLTLDPGQWALANGRIALAGLGRRVRVELRDWRALGETGAWDRIVSLGGPMPLGGIGGLLRTEAVAGPADLAQVQRLLAPGGLFLQHALTRPPARPGSRIGGGVEGGGAGDAPGTLSRLQRDLGAAGLEVLDVQALRGHAVQTLRHWGQRLQAQEAAARRCAGARAVREWRLGMALQALDLERGAAGLYQVLAARPDAG